MSGDGGDGLPLVVVQPLQFLWWQSLLQRPGQAPVGSLLSRAQRCWVGAEQAADGVDGGAEPRCDRSRRQPLLPDQVVDLLDTAVGQVVAGQVMIGQQVGGRAPGQWFIGHAPAMEELQGMGLKTVQEFGGQEHHEGGEACPFEWVRECEGVGGLVRVHAADVLEEPLAGDPQASGRVLEVV